MVENMSFDPALRLCRCEPAVLRAWHDLRALGSDEVSAFHACTALYRIHHADASLQDARDIVAEWLERQSAT
jgi:hypothetical protein